MIEMYCFHILYIMNICLFIIYNMFMVLNVRRIWDLDNYYSLLYIQTCICGWLIVYQLFLSFTFANLCFLFLVFTVFPHSAYTVLTLTYNVFLLLYTVYLLLYKEKYEEIIDIETRQNNDYPEAEDMSHKTKQNYQNQLFMYV